MRAIPTTPAYQTIADDLREQIIDGRLAPGQRLPTQAELCERYDVASATAARAIQILLSEGFATSKPGAGVFVRPRPAVMRMVRSWYQRSGTGSPWRAEMAAVGRAGDWESDSRVLEALPAVAERLRIPVGARVMCTRYRFLLDGDPTYLSTSWEPLAITEGTPVMLPEAGPYAGAGVRDRMTAIGHAPTSCTEEVAPRTLTAGEAEKLGLYPGIAVLVVERTYYEGETPLETADIVLPPHYRAVYEIPLEPEAPGALGGGG